MATVEISKEALLETFQRNKLKQMNELHMENEFCDLILKCEDGFEIRVHRVIVSAASNYFKDLLTSRMKERSEECIQLPYIPGEILKKIISFIYSNKFEEIIEDVEKIVKYAVIFQLVELIEICSLILMESINDYTFLDYWRLAKDNLIYGLEAKCVTRIVSNVEYLFENSFLNDLSIEEMCSLLSDDRLHVQCTEQKLFEYVWKWAAGKVSETKNFSEVISEVVDLFYFSDLKQDFIYSKILNNPDLVDNSELLKKIVKLTKGIHKLQENNEIPSRLVFPKPTSRRLFGLAANKIFTGLWEENCIQKDKDLSDYFGYTTFDTNYLLICGGKNSIACEYLEPVKEVWKKFPSMKSVKSGHECSYLGNKIYACGGFESESVEIFDLGQGEWHNGPEMHSHRQFFGLTTLNGSLYAIGGDDSIEMLDPRFQNWSVVNDFFQRSNDYTRCLPIGSCIYCLTLNSISIFDTRKNQLISDACIKEDFALCPNFCEINGSIYGFGFAKDSDSDTYSLNLIKYHLDLELNLQREDSDSFGIYDKNETLKNALVALYY